MDPLIPKEIIISKIVDSRGTACPGPLVAAKSVIGDLNPGEIMQVLSSDQCSRSDIPNWAEKLGNEHMGTIVKKGYFEIYIKKK